MDDDVGGLGGGGRLVGPVPQFGVAILVDKNVGLTQARVVERGSQIQPGPSLVQMNDQACGRQFGRDGSQSLSSLLVRA
jgi:hypothetical protein